MKIFKLDEFITEKLLDKHLRNKNLLDHATYFDNLLEILKQNVLYGTNTYDYGVATSRNRNYLFLNDNKNRRNIIW